MSDEIVKRLVDIAVQISEKVHYQFSSEEVEKVLRFTERKMELNGKEDWYLPILFENELEDYVTRCAINFAGGMNLCVNTATATRI